MSDRAAAPGLARPPQTDADWIAVVTEALRAGRLVEAAQAALAAPVPLFRHGAGAPLTPHLTSTLLFGGFVDLCRQVSDRFAAEAAPVREARLAPYAAQLTPERATHLRAEALASLAPYTPQRPCALRAIQLTNRLRIGHLVASAGRSSSEYFRAAEIRHHDRARYRLYHYVSKSAAPPPEQRLYDDVWVETAGLNEEALFDRIVADRIDILVDHCDINSGGHIPTLMAQPAPVQVNRGAIGTMALDTVTWRISDAVCHGPGLTEIWRERPVVLPLYQCYTPPLNAPPPATRPTQAGAILFGAFVQPVKVTEATARAWARILNAVPGSRLVLKRKELTSPDVQARLFTLLHAAGAPLDRIGVAGDSDHAQHLSTLAMIDVALDSFPFGGHTTTCEALWMGAPAPALLGERVSGRVGSSYLTAAGCGDWVARNEEDYVRLVVDLVSDPNRLWAIRRGLREKVAASPLCDGVGYTRALEGAYEMMALEWSRRCVALPLLLS